MELEKKVLAGLMQFLDEQEGESLKKHPKFAAVKVEKLEPEEGSKEEEDAESPEKEKSELSEDDMTPEMIQKILEMYEQSK